MALVFECEYVVKDGYCALCGCREEFFMTTLQTKLEELIADAMFNTANSETREVDHFDIGREFNLGNVQRELAHKIALRVAPIVRSQNLELLDRIEKEAVKVHLADDGIYQELEAIPLSVLDTIKAEIESPQSKEKE